MITGHTNGPLHGLKWLVLDIDGTLVDCQQRIVPRNLRAVARFSASGGRVILATGRIEDAARRFFDELNVGSVSSGPAILYNGARVVDFVSGALLMERTLDPDDVDATLTNVSAESGVDVCIVYSKGKAYALGDGPRYREYAQKDGISLRATNFGDVDREFVNKLLLIGPSESLGDVEERISAVLGTSAHIVRSESSYLEVLPVGANKGSALAWLADEYNISMMEIAAVGDNLNDAELLRGVGLGVAVGDGHSVLRQYADAVVCGCEEGAVGDAVNLILSGASVSLNGEV